MQTKLILGTVQFGLNYGINNTIGKPNKESVKQILDFAFENNITLLDSAEAYGDAHEVIGIYHQASKNKFKIITKFSSKRNDLPKSLNGRINELIKTLNVDELYAYMFHSYSDLEVYHDGLKTELQELKKNKLIGKIGVSIYTNEEFKNVLDRYEMDLIQLPFNLLDNNYQRSELIKKAKDKGIEVHTRSAFLQGLFFMQENAIPKKLEALKPYLEKIKNLSSTSKKTINDLTMNYVLQQQNIDRVLIGVDSLEQLKENLKTANNILPNDIIAQIDQINVHETELLNPANWNA